MSRRVPVARALVAVLGVAAVGAIALSLRLLAVNLLPIDFDEDDYLRAGQLYATGLQSGDPGVFLRENYRTEHPPLSKIVTGLALAPLPSAAVVPDEPTTAPPAAELPEPQFTVARTVQAVFGALTAVALAVLSPIAGFWLAIHTWSIKYTSQVMLEAVPAFFALLAVLCYVAALRSSRRRTAWLVAAGVAFGLACDGKYLYGVAGLAIVVDWLWRTRPAPLRVSRALGRWLRSPVAWIALSLAVFFLADPYLWPDPIGRLWASIAYHGGYATSTAVQDTGWPSWQPIVWLMGSVPFHAPGTFLVAVDLPITLLAALGFRRLWDRERVFAIWFLIALGFLVIWPTKWPQYVLVLSAPLSLSAAHGTRKVLEPVARALRTGLARLAGEGPAARSTRAPVTPERSRRAGIGRTFRDVRSAFPWLAPGLVAFALLAVIPIVYELAMSLTDLRLASLRDGMNGGVIRAAVGGLTGQVPAVPIDLGSSSKTVHYVGGDLRGAF